MSAFDITTYGNGHDYASAMSGIPAASLASDVRAVLKVAHRKSVGDERGFCQI
jgi:hypothetical protein